MSKLLIPNTCQVPNVLLDEVIPRLPAGAVRVLLAIVRFTYGFGKTSDRLSYTQLAKATKLNRRQVINAARALGKLITVKPGAKGRGANEYSLNLSIATGELLGSVKDFTSDQNCTSEISQQEVVTKIAPFQTHISKPKKNGAKAPDSLSPIIEKTIRRINELSGRAFRPDSKAITKYLRARLKQYGEADCLAVVEDKAKWCDSEKMREHFNPVTLFREENFERYLAEARAGNSSGNSQDPEWHKRTFVNG